MIDLLIVIVLGVIGMIVIAYGLKRSRANKNNGLPSQQKATIVKVKKFVKERKWGIVLLAMLGVSCIAIAIASNLDQSDSVRTGHPWHSYPPSLTLQWSGNNPNLTRTGYAVTLSQYNIPRLFDPNFRGNVSGGSVWGLSVNQMRFVYYGADDQWHETSFQLNEKGWRWIANGSISYTSAGNRPNTLLEEMQWTDGYVSSQFYPDLPDYYYPDAPKANLNAPASSTTGGYGGRLPIDANATMMDNWPEFHQTQAMEAWAGGTPNNNSQVRGAVDHDDELVFLAKNGQKVLPNNWYRNDLWSRRAEIGIVDPVDNGHSWVYLYYNPVTYATQPTPANQISADYCRTDSYIAPGESSSVNWDPTTDMIVATNYQMQMNPSNAAQFLNLKITMPGMLQTDALQEFPKSFIWADGRINFGGTTSMPPIHEGLAIKYGLSGSWYQTSPPSVAAMTGGAAPTDAPRSYNNLNAHVGMFYNRGNPDQTKHPSYGEPPYMTTTGAMGWMDGTGAKPPVYFNFPTGPALGTSPSLGPLAVREQWTTFAGAYEPNTATDHAGYCFNDSAYWVYSSGVLAIASGTTNGTWNQVLSPFQDNLALDGGAFNRKAATINGPVMAYIERISCLRVVIPFSWFYGVSINMYNLMATTNPGAGFVEGFEYYTQQDLAVFPNAFYQYNISYPVPQLPSTLTQMGTTLDHMWAYFNVFQVTRGIETAAPGTCLYLGQGVANDTSSPALAQMSAAMNMLRANPATYAWIIAHGFPYCKHIQQLAPDNTAFVYNNYPMWSWATSVTNMPAGFFPKQLTFNNISADDAANGYTATNTEGRAGCTTGTCPYHPWWDTTGAAPYQEQWIDNTAWRSTEIWNQDGGNTGSTTHPYDWQATPREMVPVVPRNTASTNVAPDWAILHVPNAGDVWVYMPVKETNEIKSKYSGTWQPTAATADDTGFAFKDNSSNVGNRIGDQEFGLFVQHIALGNSVIPYTIAMVFGNFNVTTTAAANIYGKREWVRNRLPLSLIFTIVMQTAPKYVVSSFKPMNHGLFYKPNDVVNLTVLTTYPTSQPAPTAALCQGVTGSGLAISAGRLVSGNIYKYTIQFTWTGVSGGQNVGPTLGTRHEYYYVGFNGGTAITNATCGLFFDNTAPTCATFALPATTTSPSVTIDWSTTRGSDNSDGTLKDGNGNPISGIANYTVLRNGVPVQTITGPGNGGTTCTWTDTNSGYGFSQGTVLQYSLQTRDMAGNVATCGTVQTTISLPIADPGRWDSTISPLAGGSSFQLTWASHPGSGITTGYNILRSLSQGSFYASIATTATLGTAARSWRQNYGTGNSSLLSADDTYWYILQSVAGVSVVNSTPISVIRDTSAPLPASIAPLTSPYAPTTYCIPIDITGSGKAIDPGYYGPGDPNNMGSGVATYTVWRSINGGAFASRGTVAASLMEANMWYDVDPSLPNGATIQYYLVATDNAGNTAQSTTISFTFSTANINPAGVLKITQVTTNVTTCQQGQWIGYMVKLQNIGGATTTINTLGVSVLYGGVDETSEYMIKSNFTTGVTINFGATRYYMFTIRPSAGSDLGDVLINATTTWPTGNKDWSRQPASVTIQATTMVLAPAAPPLVTAMARNMLVELDWVVPANDGGSAITNYRIYQGTTPGGETLLATVGNVLSYTSTGLTNGQVYYFEVTAVNSAGESDPSPETSAVPNAVPSTPIGLTATAGNTQVMLSWNPPISNGSAAITNYRIYQGTSSGAETFLLDAGNVTIYAATELTNGQVYFFQVSAMNSFGESPRSNEASATPEAEPSVPTGLTLVPGNAQVMLSWFAPASNGGSPITGYTIYRGTTSANKTRLVNLGVVLTYTDTGLTNGQIYYYQVTAWNVIGESPRSLQASATPATVPGAPAGLTGTAGNTQILLNWLAPSSNGGSAITNYRIYQGTSSNGETLLATIGNITTYTSTGLTNGQVYYFKVSAVNVMGEGARSPEVSKTPLTAPGVPTGLTAMPGNAQVSLNWVIPSSNGGSAITNYRVYLGTTSDGETLLATIGVVNTYTCTGLTNGQIYYFQVSAMNVIGEGACTTEVSATPVTVPTAPQSLTTTGEANQVVLNWLAPANNGGSAITGYKVYQGTTSGGETLLATLGAVLAYTSTGMTNGQIYYFQVSAINAVGEGPRSTEVTGTPVSTPSAPQSLTATPGNAQVVLNWLTPASNGDSPITCYKVYQGTTSGGETWHTTLGVVLTFTSAGLTNGQFYYFQVTAVNAAGEGARSREACVMPMTVPGMPRDLGATGGDNQVYLSWQGPADNGGSPLTNYSIYRGTGHASEVFLVSVSNETFYTDRNVSDGQEYFYQVHAINGAGEGQASNEARGVPENLTAIEPPPSQSASMPVIVFVISMLGTGAVMSVSTIVITRKIKAKHMPPAASPVIPTTSARNSNSASVPPQPEPVTSAGVQDVIPVHPPPPKVPMTRAFQIPPPSLSHTMLEITNSPVSSIIHATMEPELNTVAGMSKLLVSQADLHALEGAKAKTTSETITVWCPSCDADDDTKIVAFNENILLVCKKCLQPVIVVVECSNCFGKFTITQDDLYLERDARFRCPVCRETSGI